MKRIHYISGIVLTLFIGAHLFNHFYSLTGVEKHMQLMDNLRVIYRNIFVEALLMSCVVIQIISGLKLFFSKRKTIGSKLERLQFFSGFYMAIFLIIHVGAVLTGRIVLNLDTDFYFGAAGLNTFPLNLFFIPYYGLAVFSFFGHIAAIHGKKMKRSILGLTPGQQSLSIIIVGAMLLPVLFYGMTNGFNGFELPEVYQELMGK